MAYQQTYDPNAPGAPTHQAQVFLQPIAAPSILGLYGFAGATFMLAAWMAGWYGDANTTLFLAPFAAMFGGLAQFVAGMWAYRARDGLATAIHGTWGAFWLAFGLLHVMWAFGTVPRALGFPFVEIGVWFIVLAAITWVCFGAAMAESRALTGFVGFLALGSTLGALAFLTGSQWMVMLTGYLLLIAAGFAWYAASALMLEDSFGREVWRLGRSRRTREPVTTGAGEPGVIRGQA